MPAYLLINTGKLLEKSFSKRMGVTGLSMFIGGVSVFSFMMSLKRLKAAKGENFRAVWGHLLAAGRTGRTLAAHDRTVPTRSYSWAWVIRTERISPGRTSSVTPSVR